METGNTIAFRWVDESVCEENDTKFLHIGRPQFRNGTYLCRIMRNCETGYWYVLEDDEMNKNIIENLDAEYLQADKVEDLMETVENYFF